MSKAAACLPLTEGGIGVPDVRSAFLKLSASTVARWSTAQTALTRSVGRVLLSCTTTPTSRLTANSSRSVAPDPRIAATIAATGLMVHRQVNASPRSDTEIEILARLLPATGRGSLAERWWKHGWLHCRYDRWADGLTALKRCQEALHGRLIADSLRAAPLQRASIFLATPESEVSSGGFARLFESPAVLKDVVEFEWVAEWHVRFRSRRDIDSLSNQQVMAFRRLCDTVIFNYPALLQPQNPADYLQPRPPTMDRWRLNPTVTGHELLCDKGAGEVINLGAVTSTKAAARAARTVDATFGHFERHAGLDAFTPLWAVKTDSRPPAHSTTAPPRPSPGLQEIRAREARAISDDALIGSALASVSWKRLARLPASSSAQRLLFHKVKGLRLSGWNRIEKKRG